MENHVLNIGEAKISLEIENGDLRSLGQATINGTPLRSASTRWLPWFDAYEGDTFRHFRFLGIEERGSQTVVRTQAVSDPDALFRERRDSSGDLCFRNANWDDEPVTAGFDIVFEPAQAEVDGTSFSGFKYWFEYSGEIAIHRIVDRATWEIGGDLNDVNLVCRNWLTPPRMKIEKDTEYSTVGLDKWAKLLPGNLWGRWSLLPSFDMQYGANGIFLAWFDEVSLIRTVIESRSGEACIRHLDLHGFEQSTTARTNPKMVLYAPDVLDHTDALNLWTRVHDAEQKKSCAQFGIKEEEPPLIGMFQNWWRDFNFKDSYEYLMQVGEEFGCDLIFIDPIWQHQEAFRMWLNQQIPDEVQRGSIMEKFWHQNICVTLDFEVGEVMGGEAELKKLCDRAREKGLRVISWMASHYSPNSYLNTLGGEEAARWGHGAAGVFAAKESGRHPDTGYPASCWTANLNTPVKQKIQDQILGICQRTGLSGFLWDSFCNLGWFQADYSDGSMRPQFDKQASLYAALSNAGLYIMPEAVVTFSNHSCCALHGGDVYAGDLLGYSYNTAISLEGAEWLGGETSDEMAGYEERLLSGIEPIDKLFQCAAHKRMPGFQFELVPREKWHSERIQEIKDVLAAYKKVRHLMQRRTVLKDGAGVLWECEGEPQVFWSFKDQSLQREAVGILSGLATEKGEVSKNQVYVLK